MSYLRSTLLCLLAFCAIETLPAQTAAAPLKVTSPDGQIVFQLFEGQPAKGAENRSAWEKPAPSPLRYAVEFRGKPMIAESTLGLELEGQPALGPGMQNSGAETGAADETYTIPVGKTSSVRNHYNSLHADYEDATGRKLQIEVRVFDDGVAFRYMVPEQPALKQVRIAAEDTDFSFVKDATTYP